MEFFVKDGGEVRKMQEKIQKQGDGLVSFYAGNKAVSLWQVRHACETFELTKIFSTHPGRIRYKYAGRRNERCHLGRISRYCFLLS